MKFFSTIGAVLCPFFAATVGGTAFNPEDEASILAVTRQYAYGLMSLYQNNATNTPAENVGIWPQPYYWWEGGAAWGGMIEYSQFTGDTSHVKTLQQALTSNYGPDNDFILSYRDSQTGNDDQAFWAFAVMSALEYGFPEPDQAPAAYLDVATNAFNNIVGRWDETTCGGGLKWQIYPANAYGYDYKNAISNGCAFALGARLARYTGEQKYADWAVKIYEWTNKVGLISDNYEVFDGTDDKTNCAAVADKTQWTYNNAMFLHGSAYMFDYTNGNNTWKERTSGFLNHAELLFFSPFDNSTDVMYEWACETGESGRHCNLDQQSFKAYLSRFMAKTAVLAPFTKDTITQYLKASAIGAAKSCSGGAGGTTCGSKWYTGSWDGTSGVGQQLSALEVTQALLMIEKGTLPAKNGEPQSQPSATSISNPSSAPAATSVGGSSSKAPSSIKVAPSSSSPVETTYPSSQSPKAAPAPSASTSLSSTFAGPSAIVVPSPSPSVVSTSKLSGGLGEVKSTTGACSSPSTTVTVYVTPVSKTGASVLTVAFSTLVPAAPPAANSSLTSSSQPAQFTGAAVQARATGCSILGAVLIALVAGF